MGDYDTWSQEVFAAINAGAIARVERLLAVKDKRWNLDDPRSFGHSFMTQAAALGEASILRLLLADGASVASLDDEQDFPLESAAWGRHQEAVQVLLDAGADPDDHPDVLSYVDQQHVCFAQFEHARARKRAYATRADLLEQTAMDHASSLPKPKM